MNKNLFIIILKSRYSNNPDYYGFVKTHSDIVSAVEIILNLRTAVDYKILGDSGESFGGEFWEKNLEKILVKFYQHLFIEVSNEEKTELKKLTDESYIKLENNVKRLDRAFGQSLIVYGKIMTNKFSSPIYVLDVDCFNNEDISETLYLMEMHIDCSEKQLIEAIKKLYQEQYPTLQ